VGSRDGRASSFEKDDISPDTVELPDAFADTDCPEPDALVQAQARFVFGEDPRLDRPDPRSLRADDEVFEEFLTDALAAYRLGYIDRLFGNSAVDATVRDRRQRCPTDNVTFAERDDSKVTEVAAIPGFPRGRRGLEGRVAGRDPVEVDPLRRRPVSGLERGDDDLPSVRQGTSSNRSARTRPSIWSRIRRTVSRFWPAGSSSFQSS
jgi:hypothetical protein